MALDNTNFHGKLLVDIFTQLTAEVPELAWICEDLGQLDGYDIRPEVAFPCALIDFPNSSYDSQSNTIQRGTVTISVKLGFNPYATAHAKAPDISMEASLKRFELEQKVVNALHGWSASDEYQGLTRQTVSSNPRPDGMRVRTLQFNTQYEDDSQELTTPQSVTVRVVGGIG